MSQSNDKRSGQPTLAIVDDISKVKKEKSNNPFDSNPKQLYASSMNVSSTSISSEFGEMVSANDTTNLNLNDDWMLNTSSTNQGNDNWMSNSGLSFLETLKTSSNNNYNKNQKSYQSFGDLDEFILPLSSNNNNSSSNSNNIVKKPNNQKQQQIHELFF